MTSIEKANILKRAAAVILDFIIASIIAVGIAFLLSFILDIDGHKDKLNGYYTYYEETYNVKFGLTQAEFDALSEEEKAHYQEVEDLIKEDKDFIKENTLYNRLLILTVLISLLVGVLIVEFVLPLILKDGQTVGKKVFNLCLVKPNGVKVQHVQLFVRALFGKAIVDVIIPVYLVYASMSGSLGVIGIIILVIYLIVQTVVLFATKNKTMIHDLLALCVVVDKESQYIFESDEAREEYVKEKHKEEVKKENY